MSLTETELMQTTKIETSVQTYHGIFGHGKPEVPAVLTLSSQGITVHPGLKPDHDFGPNGDRTPDVFLERRPKAWTISISPDSTENFVVVTVFDDGGFAVAAADGGTLHTENPREARPCAALPERQ